MTQNLCVYSLSFFNSNAVVFSGICPGADAFVTEQYVNKEPSIGKSNLDKVPNLPMAIVIIFSWDTVRDASRIMSFLSRASVAIFTMSLPAFLLFFIIASSFFCSGVFLKLW